jgi:hypothetical protein
MRRTRGREPGERLRQRLGARRAEDAAAPVRHELGGAARGDGHHRHARRLRLEDRLTERVGARTVRNFAVIVL